MLMRGRAQAFSFDESARSSRLSGISVSSRKNWYSHLPPGCLAGHLQEFLQVIFDASESSDSYEEVLPVSRLSLDKVCARNRQGGRRLFRAPQFSLSI